MVQQFLRPKKARRQIWTANHTLLHLSQWVVPVWLRQVGRIEVDEVLDTALRNLRHEPFGEITVRIDNRNASAAQNVLQR